MAGFWLVTVNRATGQTSTELIVAKDDAWQKAMDITTDCPHLYTTVVKRQESVR